METIDFTQLMVTFSRVYDKICMFQQNDSSSMIRSIVVYNCHVWQMQLISFCGVVSVPPRYLLVFLVTPSLSAHGKKFQFVVVG